MSEEAVLFAAVGPYVDAFTQLVWALYRQRNTAVVEAHLVVDERGRRFIDADLLGDGAALEHLDAKLGPAVLARGDVFVHEARTPDGRWIADESNPVQQVAYAETLWRAARLAIQRAGARQVVFGLVSGRKRTTPALVATCFQLLARRVDRLLDVRLSDGRVDGFGDLFFPEQDEVVVVGSATIDPRTVSVRLVELELPRLSGLISPAPDTFVAAKDASQRSIDLASPPGVVVHLGDGSATANGERIPLSEAELVWFAFLAHARKSSADGWALAGQDGHDALREFLRRLGPWVDRVKTKPLERLRNGEYVPDEDLRNLRGKTVQKLKRWCASTHPEFSPWLVPRVRGGRWQRLELPEERIRIEGAPPSTPPVS
ncbi:MAG: hypothetical protein HYV07_15915 [Deltaproteobacteria bacterium]|nr:hypothetical protein [Deltaproteobacteria bacterium]